VYPIDPGYIDVGRKEYQHTLSIFAECWAKEEWPGYADKTLYAPEWLRQRVEYIEQEAA